MLSQNSAHSLYICSETETQLLRKVWKIFSLLNWSILNWDIQAAFLWSLGKQILSGLKYNWFGTPLAVQWLRHHASTAGGTGSIPGWGTKILHATGSRPKKKKKKLNKLQLVCLFDSLKVKVAQSCPILQPHGLYSHGIPRQEYWSG